MRIKILSPFLSSARSVAARADALASIVRDPATLVHLEFGGLAAGHAPDGIGRLAAETEVVALGARAETDGFDAVVVDSILDVGVDALRSRTHIPIIGAGRTAFVYGPMLGGRIAIAVRSEAERRAAERSLVLSEIAPETAFVTVIGTPGDGADGALVAWARERVVSDCVGTIVLGHPELVGPVAGSLADLDVVVIDPGALAMKVAEAVVDLKLRHSEIAYLDPAVDLDHLIDRRIRMPEPTGIDLPPATAPRPYRLKVVVPISGMTEADVRLRSDALAPGLLHGSTRVDYRSLSDSSDSGDCQYDTFLLDLFCAEEELLADEEGYDAVLVDSTTDSGIASVRPHLRALTVGPGEACWALASVIGEHFSTLSMERKWEFFFIKGPKMLGLRHRLASVEDIGRAPDPVRLFEGKEDLMNELLIEAARRGIDEHRADVVIIGSTTMHQAAAALTEALPVPVLSPGRVGVRTAEMLLDLGLRHVRGSEPSATDPTTIFDPETKKEAPLVHA
jgi:allantoin racemase